MADLSCSAVIVSYNTRQMTLECLRCAIGAAAGIATEIWVVDNGSTDGSVEAIKTDFPNVKLFENSNNVGFGAANNMAMRASGGKYLLLLNSDAFMQDGALDAMVDYLERHPRVAAVGPRLVNADGSLQISCFPFPSPRRAWVENLWLAKMLPHTSRLGDYRKWAHDQERVVDFVIGACMLVRRSAYEAVGGFDERFFMYSEEADWQRRMRNAGWTVAFTPAARVKHLGGASGAGSPAIINRHFFDSLDRYELKHHGFSGFFMLRTAMVLGSSMRAMLWGLAWLVRPGSRPLASSKLKLHLWLVARQLTHGWAPPRPAGGSEQWGMA